MDANDDNADEQLPSQSEEGDAGCTRPVQKRRQYSKAFKRQVVEEALTGEDSVSVVARRHDINTNLVFNWRKQYLAGKYEEDSASALIPITVTPMVKAPALAPDKDYPQERSGGDRLEIALTGGHRLVIEGAVSPVVLRTALEVLKA